ncbi:kinesin-related protein 4-like [Teleopsis dalmanni]|uniref:kinesin-related protein 4-like n=2 Tax=Teleopsis dalmanni TaxID=139649 RepID=UPI0018CF862D|nr:kinesin-related protein 4-like [Teleopsis dalmanni]
MSIKFFYNFPQIAREAGFKLHLYNDGFMDWRHLGTIEIERVLREQNLEQIDGLLNHLSEAPLGSILNSHILDNGIAKYFIFLQFAIQYLLFCRNFLDETVVDLREAHAKSQIELAKLKTSHADANNELLQLQKKITQMEAIHEVIYPCHLCTKNFISNEALNLHISRKHCNTGKIFIDKKKPMPTTKDIDNDMQLINAIKFELEIKQLKERLNVAEKEIRERKKENVKTSGEELIKENVHVQISPAKEEQESKVTVTQSIGIQSNLIEVKEADDTSVISDTEVREQIEQLRDLQLKIQDIETWREEHNSNNEDCIAEINEKLADIVQTIGKSITNLDTIEEKSNSRQEQNSPTVEDLERLLSQKMEEISMVSVQKIEEVVQNLQLSYREKLYELENEVKRLNFESQSIQHEESSNNTNHEHDGRSTKMNNIEVESSRKSIDNSENTSKNNEPHIYVKTKTDFKEKNMNSTYKQDLNKEDIESLDSLSVKSNETFIKTIVKKDQEENLETKDNLNTAEDIQTDVSTDDSESLTSNSESEASKSEDEISKNKQRGTKTANDNNLSPRSTNIQKGANANIKKENSKRKSFKAQQYTRDDAKQLINKKLSTFGFSLKTKNLPRSTLKNIAENLAEERSKQNRTFNVTRNKIKKFVDKICSNKLPQNAEHVLENKKPLRPADVMHKLQQQETTTTISSDESFAEHEAITSTPTSEKLNINSDFKQRLEKILASPIRQPSSSIVQSKPVQASNAPVPVPRKRVMFNTLKSDTESLSNERKFVQ